MGGWSHLKSQAVALPVENIDTDQIIPARFMSAPRAQGYGGFLFHDMRRDGEGSSFPLGQFPQAQVLVAGPNFGSGSSREAAVYALYDAGIRVVVAPSFGDIFASNAVNNGLLPARLKDEDVNALLSALATGAADCAVDLNDCTVRFGGETFTFALEESWRMKLMNGWDDIDLTMQNSDAIETFKGNRIQTAAWAWPAPTA